MSKLIPKFNESRKITIPEEQFIPPIIREIINNNRVLLGGSIALRCADITGDYSNWGEYDFDLYTTDFDYDIVKKIFKDNPNIFKKLKKTLKQKISKKKNIFLYSNLKIKDIVEYLFFDKLKHFKIQLVNIGDYSDFGVLHDAIDLSFCSVLYCGLNKTLYFLKTTQLEITNRRGTFFPNKIENECGHLNFKSITRVLKYISRGFKITNLDPFTKQTKMISRVSEKIISNWFDHLFHVNNNVLSFQNVLDGKYKITESMVNSVIPIIVDCNNNSMYLTGFLLTALSKNIDIMTKYYGRFLHKFDINIPCYKRLIHYLLINGLYTAFKLIFEFYMKNKQVIESDLISMMINDVTMYNYINSALLICKHIPTVRIQIFEDRISKQWRILSIFESFLEIEDNENKDETIMALIKQLPFLTTLSHDEIEECNICPICNTSDVNVKIVSCKHSFCTNCLFGMFDVLERNKKPLTCQICRAVCREKP